MTTGMHYNDWTGEDLHAHLKLTFIQTTNNNHHNAGAMSPVNTLLQTSNIDSKQCHLSWHTAASWVNNVGSAGSCNIPTDGCKFPTPKLILKLSMTFTLNSSIVCVDKKALLSQRRPRDAPNIWVP